MMRLLRRLALALSLLMPAGEAVAEPPAYELRVDGLACPFCAYGIEKQLARIAGVVRIEVDIASGAVTVRLDQGAALDEAAARDAVERAGFSLRAFERIDDSGAKD
jgi:mercuric ion binding protein